MTNIRKYVRSRYRPSKSVKNKYPFQQNREDYESKLDDDDDDDHHFNSYHIGPVDPNSSDYQRSDGYSADYQSPLMKSWKSSESSSRGCHSSLLSSYFDGI
jgi:hypothetical protein